jgi:cobalt/nickel transport system permease protein
MSGAHVAPLDAEGRSAIHRAPALSKLLVALAAIAVVALLPVRLAWLSLVVILASLALARAARVPVLVLTRRIALAEPFVLGVAVLALFQGRGLAVFGALVAKSTASVAAIQLLAHTTPFPDLLLALRRARAPSVVVLTLGLLYRYSFILVAEVARVRRARASRTFAVPARSAWRGLAAILGAVLVRTFTRSERVSAAMRSRGFS